MSIERDCWSLPCPTACLSPTPVSTRLWRMTTTVNPYIRECTAIIGSTVWPIIWPMCLAHGQIGKKPPIILYNYRSRQFHRTFNRMNPSMGKSIWGKWANNQTSGHNSTEFGMEEMHSAVSEICILQILEPATAQLPVWSNMTILLQPQELRGMRGRGKNQPNQLFTFSSGRASTQIDYVLLRKAFLKACE